MVATGMLILLAGTRVINKTAPQYNTRHHAVALTTSIVNSLRPYEIAVYYQRSRMAQ